jgi:hypothetical protein
MFIIYNVGSKVIKIFNHIKKLQKSDRKVTGKGYRKGYRKRLQEKVTGKGYRKRLQKR